MTPATILTALYGASGLAGAACYLPQLRLLWRTPEARRALSPLAWGGWTAIGAIGLLYALFAARDPVMAAVCGLNLLCQVMVFALAAAARLGGPRPRTALPAGNTSA